MESEFQSSTWHSWSIQLLESPVYLGMEWLGSACLYNYLYNSLELLLEWTRFELSKSVFSLYLSSSFAVLNDMR